MCGSLLVQSGYVARVQTRLKSIHQPGRVMGGGNLRRISRGRAFSRSRKMVFSYRLDDASPVERERSSSVRSFRGREMKKRKKKEETTRVSRGWQLQFVYATFFPPVLLHDKSQRDEWATLDWSERSRPLETRSFAPLRKKTEIRRMKEKLRGQGLKVKRSKG